MPVQNQPPELHYFLLAVYFLSGAGAGIESTTLTDEIEFPVKASREPNRKMTDK
jgi:hypothetical protein